MARWWAALGVAAAALLVGAADAGAGGTAAAALDAPAGEVCELARVDRARTPSQACMSCHDGTAGPGIGFEMSAGGHGMSHPVEVDYALVAARQPDRYVPPSSLPADVTLVEGKVTCTSCHDGASPHPKRTLEPSTLCYACHNL